VRQTGSSASHPSPSVLSLRVTILVASPHSVRLIGVSTSDTLLSHTRFSLDAAPKVAALFAKDSPDSLQSKLLGILLRYWLRLRNPCVTPKALRFCALLGIAMGPSHTRGVTRLYHEFASMNMPFASLRRGHEGRTQGATPVSHVVIELCLMMTARVTSV